MPEKPSPTPDPVLSAWRVDRTAVSVAKLTDPPDEVAYWLSRPAEERWAAIELIRRINYGPAAAGHPSQLRQRNAIDIITNLLIVAPHAGGADTA